MTADPRRTDRQLDQVLDCLVKNMTVAVSGERLAEELDVSHSRMVRLVNRLRALGVDIRGEPFSGFRLARLPDILLPSLIEDRLHSGAIGHPIHHLYRTESTNAYAMSLAWKGEARHGALVVAEEQSAGRGRRGRSWCSEPIAGLYLSLVLEPEVSCSLAPLITLAAAVAAHDALERITGLDIDVKWPNDLLVGRRKVGGILAELQAEPDQVRSLVLGVGLNVNQDEFPKSLGQIATSLRAETGKGQSRVEVLLEFLVGFERLYSRFIETGPEAVISSWSAVSSFASGRVIEVYDGVRTIRGVSDGLSPLGALRIRGPETGIAEVYSGDVIRWE